MDKVMRPDKDSHRLKGDKREMQSRAGLVEQLPQTPAPKAQGLCSEQQCGGLLGSNCRSRDKGWTFSLCTVAWCISHRVMGIATDWGSDRFGFDIPFFTYWLLVNGLR